MANKNSKTAAITKRKRIMAMTCSVIAIVMAFIIILSVCIATCNPSRVDPTNYNYDRFNDDANFVKEVVDDSDWSGVKSTAVTDGYEKGTSKAPTTSEYLGVSGWTSPVPELKNEGLARYPVYGKNLSNYTEQEMLDIINESRALTPYPTWKSKNIFDALDKDGYLLRNGEKVSDGNGGYKKLYKHTASVGMYMGNVDDDEPRISKKITCMTRRFFASNQITGLYAPAGEVIKIEMSQEDLAATGGLRVYIGQNYNLDQQVSMEWNGSKIKGNGFNRMSDILSSYVIKSTEGYVGSFLGGPIYVRPVNNSIERNISVTISGGVRYQHFILGATTEKEYDDNAKSSAPYFDLEIYDAAIRFSLPNYYLKNFSYKDCTDAAILWDKITQVSKRVQANGLTSSAMPVMAIGDCYIAAGAAFANPGRNGIVCPFSWYTGALSYNSFVNNGSWGVMHEYNHCWQGYGAGNGGEVTNNATTLIAYSLYTRTSSYRTMGAGSGWTRFTDPSQAMHELLALEAGGSKRFDLSLYATLLHNIGQDNFVAAARGGRESGSTVYYNNLVNATHYDMTYYFTELLNYDIAETGGKGTLARDSVDAVKAKNYPVFVPVSSVYQVGRSIIYDNEKQYITTAQPFKYGAGEFVMDFSNKNNFKEGVNGNKALVIPDGFTANVVSVTQPKNGKVELLEDNQVKYTPAENSEDICSGNFRVKLRITHDKGEFIVEDVDLVINLQQSSVLQRTTYTYTQENMIDDPTSVLDTATGKIDFGNYAEKEVIINKNPAQNCNSEIWASGINYYQDGTNKEMPEGLTVQTLDGCLYFDEAGKYKLGLRGRGHTALFISYDKGQTWELAIDYTYDSTKGGTGFSDDFSKEIEITEDDSYVYYKIVQVVTRASNNFFGLGLASEELRGTGVIDEETEQEVQELVFGNIAYVNAYSNEAVHKAEQVRFESEYHFKNEYKYSYLNVDTSYATGHSLVSLNFDPWDNSGTFVAANLFDGNTGTSFHSKQNNFVSESNPLELVVNIGTKRKVNSVTFYGYHSSSVGNLGMATTFKLYGSANGTDYFLLTERTDMTYNSRNVALTFDDAEIQYYKLVVTKTDNGRYFAMNRIEFSYTVSYPNGNVAAPNDFYVRYIGDSWSTENTLCTFGLIYKANAGDSVEFRFTGTRFAYFAYQSSAYGKVDIYLDGNLIASDVDLSADKNIGELAYMYLDETPLENKDHIVKIVGKSGKFNVDSFVSWE